MESEIVKMSEKGQLVVPMGIREKEGFNAGDRFVSVAVKEGVLFKRVKMPDVKIEFDKLAKEIKKQFEKQNIKEEDVKEAVRWARRK